MCGEYMLVLENMTALSAVMCVRVCQCVRACVGGQTDGCIGHSNSRESVGWAIPSILSTNQRKPSDYPNRGVLRNEWLNTAQSGSRPLLVETQPVPHLCRPNRAIIVSVGKERTFRF